MSKRIQRTIEEYLATNPTRADVAKVLCKIANSNVLPMHDLGLFYDLAPLFNLTLDDFYDDQSVFSEYERNYIGLYNWTVKEGVI